MSASRLLIVAESPTLQSVATEIAKLLLPTFPNVTVSPADAPLDKRAFVTEVSQGRIIVALQPAANATTISENLFFHHRFVWVEGVSSAAEVAADITFAFTEGSNVKFVSTRGEGSDGATFLGVVREGLAPDGGLYMPTVLPRIPPSLAHHLAHTVDDYRTVCQLLFERLADRDELPAGVLAGIVARAYAAERWSGRDDICPLVPLRDGVFMLELFHGPTAAFKDFALQLFPHMFAMSTLGDDAQYMILAATSGDTGVAAISGFMNAAPETRVMVLYPQRGVSPVQKVQMISCDGGAVRVFGVHSDFDFCQTTVKHIFNDATMAATLKRDHGIVLSSANSINWGRLTPQIVYYFHAYGELVRRGVLKFGETFDVAVPTGNFGNILSAYIGMMMGLPIRRFVVASNQNDVLFEFVMTGKYDIRSKSLVPTISPSIDILKASNIERFIHIISGGDSRMVADCMKRLNTDKHFELPEPLFAAMRERFWAANCDEPTCHRVIGETFEASGRAQIVDPHTAVAVHVVAEYEKHLAATGAAVRPIVIAATAHWAKFPEPVLSSISGAPSTTGSASDNATAATAVAHIRSVYDKVASAAGNTPSAAVAAPLVAALNKAETGAAVARESPASEDTIRQLLLQFVAEPLA